MNIRFFSLNFELGLCSSFRDAKWDISPSIYDPIIYEKPTVFVASDKNAFLL
jgi:hypothetical protein